MENSNEKLDFISMIEQVARGSFSNQEKIKGIWQLCQAAKQKIKEEDHHGTEKQ